MTIKRYEYWTRNGREWTSWFPWNSDNRDKWQLNNKLKNEYKEVTGDEWKKMQKENQKS